MDTNHEHIYESRRPWDAQEHSRRVRRFGGHILTLPVGLHVQMNSELGHPDFSVISLRLSNFLMSWAYGQEIGTPENRVPFVEKEELFFRQLGAFQRTRPLGREAVYFADCLEMKLPYYREGQKRIEYGKRTPEGQL